MASTEESSIALSSRHETTALQDATDKSSGSIHSPEKRLQLFSRERQVVRRCRFLVYAVLFATGLIASLGTFFYTRSADRIEFQEDVEEISIVLRRSIRNNLRTTIEAIDAFASDVSTFAQFSSNVTTWPFVTIPRFEEKGVKLQNAVKTTNFLFLPLVPEADREAWEAYAVNHHQKWLQESLDYQSEVDGATPVKAGAISPSIYNEAGSELGTGPYLPLWQTTPQAQPWNSYNFNMLNQVEFAEGLQQVLSSRKAVVAGSFAATDEVLGLFYGNKENSQEGLLSLFFQPIYESHSEPMGLVGVLATLIDWNLVFETDVTFNADGLIAVLETNCGESSTYMVNEHSLEFVAGDLYNHNYGLVDDELDISLFDSLGQLPTPVDSESCQYRFSTYDSKKKENGVSSQDAAMHSTYVALIFVFTMLLFILYDYVVQKQQQLILQQAEESTALVSSLFPEGVCNRLMRTSRVATENGANKTGSAINVPHDHDILDLDDFSDSCIKGYSKESPKWRLKSMIRESTADFSEVTINETRPIADFFPNCTVLFADIVGFTAWSSQHSPGQVFTLLQNVYAAFDKIARKLDVFKVETIGDSYVAVTGLPDHQEDHALIMTGFALECRSRMREVTGKLERALGPETGDLRMRFGMHSGPVTAGVLRGDRARFQLFGDTVNTASRMESSGMADRLQVSESTAVLLRSAGKVHWIQERAESIHIKGKGDMKTFWIKPMERDLSLPSSDSLEISSQAKSPRSSMENFRDVDGNYSKRKLLMSKNSMVWGDSQEFLESMSPPMLRRHSSDTVCRLIDWNVEMLSGLLKQLVAKREYLQKRNGNQDGAELALFTAAFPGSTALDEVVEIITLPKFDANAVASLQDIDPDLVTFESDAIEKQLRDYVTAIASMYRDNPFHSYEHACHVQLSMCKLLQRVVAPDGIDCNGDTSAFALKAHTYTYGITSDPLTQFAVVFCALIHDVDHTGVSNGQLIKEKAHVASLYRNQSIAEQNSVDLAWDLLMDERYMDLRKVLFRTQSDFTQFRQLVVNVVLATDIFDKELSTLRKNRWNKAFTDVQVDESASIAANRKATIVIEHLIQASDVSHTMQHWDVYCKWNERLFYEMYAAFKSGRTDTNPAPGWYKGELWFFDNYVIPLAKKLKDCGVFGVCSDECLNYALENRNMWEAHGEAVVAMMLTTDFYTKLKQERMARMPQRRAKLAVDL